MEKIVGSHLERLPATILYIDDLEKLVEIFQEVSKEVSIILGEYKLKDFSEIATIGEETVHSVHLSCSTPHISLDLDSHEAYVYIGKNDAVSRGILEKLKLFVRERRRKLAPLIHSTWLAGAVLGTSTWFFFGPKTTYNLSLGSALAFLGIVWTLGGLSGAFRQYTIVRLKRRKDEVSFWRRNQDRIIVDALLAAFGFLLGRLWR